MRTYRVSYRVVSDLFPNINLLFQYTIDAHGSWSAESIGYDLMAEDVKHLVGSFNEDWIKRTTITRIK